jgi:hypothetical protein
MEVNAIRLSEPSALRLTRDARLVAIRWDIMPWALVLDLDTPISEAKKARMRRSWIVFSGVSEINLPITQSRLPSGIWLTDDVAAEKSHEEFINYKIPALLPRFKEELLVGNPRLELGVLAKGIIGVQSTATAIPDDTGLTWENRVRLASDIEMKLAAGEV